ncbi:MAG TPA: response regulator [Acetobacteraceae bacterium]|jgi:DNA-binding NtrC family response regulator|nr:response regulator [Acetobacteraceae bacterium]
MSPRRHILVVEDDPLVAEVIAAALDDDYRTSLVETSAAALDALAAGGIDLVLLDCTLPDGIHPTLIPAADRLRLPVVLMSGDPQRMESLTSQPRPFILKPFTLADLIAAVAREIGRAARASA